MAVRAKIDGGKDKYAVFHYLNGYNTNRKDECDAEQWFQSRQHVLSNPRLKEYVGKKR